MKNYFSDHQSHAEIDSLSFRTAPEDCGIVQAWNSGSYTQVGSHGVRDHELLPTSFFFQVKPVQSIKVR